MLSAQYAATTGEMLAQRFSRILPLPDRVVQPVLVDLVPTQAFEWESQFVTRIYPSGQVKVSVAWGETTSRGTLERAVAQGYLTYLAGIYSQGAVTVPLWLELALQHLARAQTVGSHTRFLAAQVRDGPPMRLESILSAERGEAEDAELAPYAYWLLTFLDREGRGQGQMQNFLIRLFRGEAPLVALNAAYGENLRSTSEAEVWWLVGSHELVRSGGSPLLPVKESRRRLRELSRFTFGVEGKESRLFAEDLWEHRASASLQDELHHRGRVLAIEMASIHPFYHNALLSLDRLFQALLVADEEEFREAIIDLRHDLRAGDELAEDTASILDDLQSELNE